jgi:hypothetical protein
MGFAPRFSLAKLFDIPPKKMGFFTHTVEQELELKGISTPIEKRYKNEHRSREILTC